MHYHRDYFYIEMEMLGSEKVFSFQLYVFNPGNKTHTLFLHSNSPLDESREKLLKFIIERKGLLAISRKQKKTFLTQLSLNESDIPNLRQHEETQDEKNRKVSIALLEEHRKKNPFNIHQQINIAVIENNFTKLIEEAKLEICCFPLDIAPTVSIASMLAEDLLSEDNFTNRIVTLCYFMAKILKINDEKSLADVVVAGFLAHTGLTQMEYSIFQSNLNNLNDKDKKIYRKHPGLSQHLLRKSKLNLSDRCINIILEHHERADGKGYPHNKVEDYLDLLSLLLGAVSHLVEQTSGVYDGKKKSFEAVIKKMSKKEINDGIECEFGDTILETLKTLLSQKSID